MRQGWLVRCLFVICTVAVLLGVPVQVVANHVTGEVIVGFSEPSEAGMASQIMGTPLARFGGDVLETIPELGVARVRLPSGREQSFVSSAAQLGEVAFAEHNYLFETCQAPNDPLWAEQWAPQLINAPDAWSTAMGDRRLVVAVIDTGVDYTHEDLGFVRLGYDFVDDDDDPHPGRSGHGTHVAGIIAATRNNALGIVGTAQVSILAIRVLGETGSGSIWDIAHGIVYAVRRGAQVVNLSLGGSRDSRLLSAAVDFADAAGVLIVAAAGNARGGSVLYPAAYDKVIAVSAVDRDRRLANFSSVGPQVELAAPGASVLSTLPQNDYGVYDGTSMAAPHVAGVAALVLSVNPELTSAQVRTILQETAVDLGSTGRNEQFGYGLVDAAAAVQAAVGDTPDPSVEVEIRTDRANYRAGEHVSISYRVAHSGMVTLYRVGPSATPQRVFAGVVEAGERRVTAPLVAATAGVESVVIQTRLPDGRYVTAAHAYRVGDARELARVWVDRGCGSTYQIGEAFAIRFSVEEASDVELIGFGTDGEVKTYSRQSLSAGETGSVRVRAVGPKGTGVIVLRAVTSAGVVVTAHCAYTIID